MPRLPVPAPGRQAAEAFVLQHLAHLVTDDARGSERFRGGQRAADAALAAFDVAGYAGRRNEVLPMERRGASALSPWIRHGLLTLPQVWDHVAGGPRRDVEKFRDELLWQEYARHLYARLGPRTGLGLRREQAHPADAGPTEVWDRTMACIDATVGELEDDGWLVNQTRMWLASHWAIRMGVRWQRGEDEFFRHLLDGSRAANRLGWQWTSGVGSSKPYGFSRWQVDKRAPELCRRCVHDTACPIADWPDDPALVDPEVTADLGKRPSAADGPVLHGPEEVVRHAPVEAVWLTAESLGADDQALTAYPDLPAIFVFDEPLLARLRLSGKRLVFLTETLAELAESHALDVRLGSVAAELGDRPVAVTHAPVPGFARRAAAVRIAERHPWPWLRRPGAGSVRSFSAWRKGVTAPR